MSDQRLRAAERKRHEDEAAWLVERLRMGSLTRERLDLAAWCGHDAAIRAGGTPGPDDPEAWLRGLEVFDPALALWALAEVPGGDESLASAARRERLRVAARGAFFGNDLRGWVRRELDEHPPRGIGATVKRMLLALHHLAREPRLGDPNDPDVLRALETVRPRFPYLDPGSWRYAWSERRAGIWAHRLRFMRAKGGESPHLADAAPDWSPPPGAPWAGPRILDDMILRDVCTRPGVVVEAAIRWALR